MHAAERRSRQLRLRPLVDSDLEQLVAARATGVGLPIGGDERSARRVQQRKIERSGRFSAGRLDLGIELHGRLVGTVEARQPPGGLPPGVFEIGISVFDQSDRGAGLGTAAVELFTAHLFSDAGTQRVQASTWVDNVAMRRVLEKLDFRLEGVLRAFMPAGSGDRHDYALYAVTRADWERRP